MKDPNHTTSEGLQMLSEGLPSTIGNRAPKALLAEYAVVVRRMEDELLRLRHGSSQEAPANTDHGKTDPL